MLFARHLPPWRRQVRRNVRGVCLAMKAIPRSAAGWLGLLLVPFKVFVPAGYLMVVIQRENLGYRNDIGAITPFVIYGYLWTFIVLVFGALFQRH
jgi:hypothetical protein